MPNSLPFPVRVAAGLVSTGLDTLRGLPENLPTIGVEIAGHVTKAGLQLRQQFVDLAIRGDELLQREPEPEEHPAWAHFDDEEPDLPGSSADDTAADATAADATAADATAADATAADATAAGASRTASGSATAGGSGTTSRPAAATSDGATSDGATSAGATPAGATSAGATSDAAADDQPLPGYDSMTMAQVRGHLRHLDVEQVRRLLEHEKAGGNRPAMVTLLGNRIVTLQHR
ncbi:lipid droplet-associated protein [Nakamurella lactea]|uniref:lipid droplet-associated protein n=1 Tax=Nakamurella lactea TaxID=459515 RepID=UPI000404D586|nr:lipid droplet-associated protein [Nakamurella lactea]